MNTIYSVQIPVISYQALTMCSSETIASLRQACEQWGFFRLVDVDFGAGEIDQFLKNVHAFFALPADQKSRLTRTENNPWGYYDRELTKNRQDWKEIYDLGLDQINSQYESRTPWPEHPTGFRESMLAWHDHCEDISLNLLAAIGRSLELPDTTFTPFFKPEHTSFLRLNHYPVCAAPADENESFPEAGHLGIHHHTDAGAVTVLLQDQVSGLQVRHDDNWVTIPVDPDSLIINVGDLVQVWSNDRYQAPLHRVLANSEKERFSAAFFMNPAFESDCVPLCVEAPRYRTVNWGEFRASRAAGDYANLGNEVQITDYRLG